MGIVCITHSSTAFEFFRKPQYGKYGNINNFAFLYNCNFLIYLYIRSMILFNVKLDVS